MNTPIQTPDYLTAFDTFVNRHPDDSVGNFALHLRSWLRGRYPNGDFEWKESSRLFLFEPQLVVGVGFCHTRGHPHLVMTFHGLPDAYLQFEELQLNRLGHFARSRAMVKDADQVLAACSYTRQSITLWEAEH